MSGSTSVDAAGGLGYVIGGACLALTGFGLFVIIASLFHVELIPHSNGLTMLLLVGILVVGAVVGAGLAAASRRSSSRR